MFDFLSSLYDKAKSLFTGASATPSNGVQPNAINDALAPKPLPGAYIGPASTSSPVTYTNPIPPSGNLGAPVSPAGSATSLTPSTSAPAYKPPIANPSVLTASGGTVPQVIPTSPVMRQATTPTRTSGSAPAPSSPVAPTNGGFSIRSLPSSSAHAPPPRAAMGAPGTGTGFMGSSGGGGLTAAGGALPGVAGTGQRFFQGAGPLGVYDANALAAASEDETKQQQGNKFSLPVPPTPGSRYVGPKPEALLQAPAIPSTLDTATIQQYVKDTSAYMSSPGAKSEADLTGIRNNLQQILNAGVASRMQQKGITPENTLVEDTHEQQNFFNQFPQEERFNYQKFADEFRTQNGMSDWLKLKESGKAALIEATKFYNDLIKEVRANPDLPKTLAERRVKLFMDDRDELIQKARADITMAENAIGDINQSLNSQLGIVQAQRSEDDKEKSRELDIFKTLLENGVQFTSAEKSSWAKKLGLPAGALDSIMAKPNLKYETSNGVIYQFDAAGNLLKTFGTPTKAAPSAGLNPDSPIDQQFMLVAPRTPGAYAIAAAQFKALEGNPIGQQKYIEKLAMDGMAATQKTAFTSAGKLVNDTTNALSALDNYTSTSGVYKSLGNKALPFAGLEQDQKYNDLKARIEGFQGQRINDIYGAALTGGELSRANQYFVDFTTDSIDTIRTKLNNLNLIAQSDKNFYLQTAMGNLDSGTTPTSTAAGTTNDDTIFQEEVGSTGAGAEGGGFWSDLWSAITGK